MPFPLRTPDELTRQQEALMEAAVIAARPDASPQAVARAVRSPRGMLAAIVRGNAMLLYEAHLHLAWWGRQYFPDQAEIEQLVEHADIWGIARRPATQALGRAIFTGATGTIIPLGTMLTAPLGAALETIEAGEIDGGGSATVDVRAVEPGEDGNQAAGTILTLEQPIDGLTAQSAEVEAYGIAGGAPIESPDALLARLLERIREPAHGGAAFDYPVWVQNAFAAAKVKTIGYVGSVAVVVAMGSAAEPRAPIPAEVDAILAYLQTVRPLGMADLMVVPAELVEIAHTIVLDPDDAPVRTAVASAISTFYARDAEIGGTLYRSRLSEAISAAAGEYRHVLSVPAADVVSAPNELPVPGAITWEAP